MWIKEHDTYLEYYQGRALIGTQTMTNNGWEDWTQEQINTWNNNHPVTFDVKEHVYSIRQVVDKLRELGLWEGIKSSLTEEQQENINISRELAFDDTTFSQLYDQLKTQIENIDEILKECIL